MKRKAFASLAGALLLAGPAAAFNFGSPQSATIVTQDDLANALSAFFVSAGTMNSRGVELLPGATPAQDRIVMWVDEQGTGNTWYLYFDANIANPSGSDMTIIGGSTLEVIYGGPHAAIYGTFTADNGLVAWMNGNATGEIFAMPATLAAPPSVTPVITNPDALARSGAFAHLTGDLWAVGRTSDNVGDGELLIANFGTGTVAPLVAGGTPANFTDIRDMASIPGATPGTVDLLVANRAAGTVHYIADAAGPNPAAPVDITPAGLIETQLQGLAAVDRNLYIAYDALSGVGFGGQVMRIVENDTVVATYSWNQIGAAGAGLGTDQLSVDFHNGMAIRRPNPQTVEVYLSNFGQFGSQQLVRVVFSDPSANVDDWQAFD